MTKQSKIQKLKEYFEKCDNVVFAFLFGSQAEKRTHSHSDWDIAVYFKPTVKKRVEWEYDRKYPDENKVWNDCIDILQTDDVDLIVLNRCPATVADSAIRGIALVIKDRMVFWNFMLFITGAAEDFRQTAKEYAEIYWRSKSLTKQDAYELDRRLIFLDSELKALLPKYSDFTWLEYQKNDSKRRELERLIENLMNSSIDAAKIILASEKRTTPSTYKELLKTLGSVLPFSPKITEKLAHWAELRNIIAHEYLDIKWERIQGFLQHSKSCFNSFLKSSKQFLETSRSE